jgi:hypothetical protein
MCQVRDRVSCETWGARGTTPYFTTVLTTFIVITLISVVPFFVFCTTKTPVIVNLYPMLPYLIVFCA